MVAPQFEPIDAFGFEHRSKLKRCYKQLDFIVFVWVILLEYQFPGKVGSDLGEEKLLPRSDGPLSSSELGEYPTYIIRLSRIIFILIGNASQINRSRNSV